MCTGPLIDIIARKPEPYSFLSQINFEKYDENCNRITLIAPAKVINAINDFNVYLDATATNNKDRDIRNKLWDNVLSEIRSDIGLKDYKTIKLIYGRKFQWRAGTT